MKKITLTSIFFCGITLICQSQNIKKSKYDFLSDKAIERFSPDSTGRISFRTYYMDKNNNLFGNASCYMIHKNGGNWWYREAKKRFPDNIQNCEFKMAKRLLKEDKDSLRNYNKWAFFLEKKYLTPIVEIHGETGEKSIAYYPKENTPLEVILYQQSANDSNWVEIDRKTFKNVNVYYKTTWDTDFIKKKLAESNLKK